MHDRILKGYYDQRSLYMNDRDKLNAINTLIQIEQEEVQALYKLLSDLRTKLSESQYQI